MIIANLPMENANGLVRNPVRDAFETRDRLLLDQFHQKSHQTPPRTDIEILGIDDASQKLDTLWPEDIEASPALKAMKTVYPFPRRVWAYLLDRMFEAGAKVVFLDLTFKGISLDPEDDRLFREALERHKGKVVLGAKFEWERVGNESQAKQMRPEESLGYTSSTMPFDVGLLNYWADIDEVIRKAQFTITSAEAEIAFQKATNPDSPAHAVEDATEKPIPSISRVVASKVDPASLNGLPSSARIRFCGAYSTISLHEVFVDSLWKANLGNGARFKDKVVYVGAVAQDLQDFQKTPLGTMAGVLLHADAFTALMAKSFIYTAPEWWRWVSIVLAVLLAWLVVTFLPQPLLCLLSLAILSAGGFYSSYLVFDRFDIESSPLSPLLALNLCGVAGLIGNFVSQLRESKKLQRFLARYTSPEFAGELMNDRAGLYTTLGGVERTVTIFFSDLRGFTTMSEDMGPTELAKQLNDYFSRMVEPIFKTRGLVDKFIGDAIMALWGSTRSNVQEGSYKEDAINALTACFAMRKSLEELNVERRSRGQNDLAIGMGIHQGKVIVANIGSEAPYEKMDLTVIGDSVNLASRLEGTTKEYGVDLIISESVRAHVQDDFICRTADLVAVKGKVKPVEVFAVIGPASEPRPAGLETFEIGVKLYRDPSCRFAEAEAAFMQAKAEGLDDKLTNVYIERCQELQAHPPEHWDGVFKMTKK